MKTKLNKSQHMKKIKAAGFAVESNARGSIVGLMDGARIVVGPVSRTRWGVDTRFLCVGKNIVLASHAAKKLASEFGTNICWHAGSMGVSGLATADGHTVRT